MRQRRFWVIILMGAITLVVGLLWAAPAKAGGWVVITLDDLPAGVHAGETVNLGLMVRQHGRTPIDTVSPAALATNQETGETVRVEAEKGEGAGHFTLAIVLPSQGVWDVQITAEPFGQTLQLAPITVLPAVTADRTGSFQPKAGEVARVILRWTALGLLAAAVLLAFLSARHESDRHELDQHQPESLTPRPSD
jgi:hypothetical protein